MGNHQCNPTVLGKNLIWLKHIYQLPKKNFHSINDSEILLVSAYRLRKHLLAKGFVLGKIILNGVVKLPFLCFNKICFLFLDFYSCMVEESHHVCTERFPRVLRRIFHHISHLLLTTYYNRNDWAMSHWNRPMTFEASLWHDTRWQGLELYIFWQPDFFFVPKSTIFYLNWSFYIN